MGKEIITKIDDQTLQVKLPEEVSQLLVSDYLASQKVYLNELQARIDGHTAARDSYDPIIAEDQIKLDAKIAEIKKLGLDVPAIDAAAVVLP